MLMVGEERNAHLQKLYDVHGREDSDLQSPSPMSNTKSPAAKQNDGNGICIIVVQCQNPIWPKKEMKRKEGNKEGRKNKKWGKRKNGK